MSPEELLRRLQEGEANAGALLYDTFAPDVNRLVWRLLGADADHDDLVQKSFIRILQACPRIREPAALPTMVRRITVNTVRSEFRRRRTRRFLTLGRGDIVERSSSTSDPESGLLLSAAYEVLERLPAEQRIAFVLRYVEGHTLEEIAERMDISLSTTKRTVKKASENFRKIASRDPRLRDRLDRSRWGSS